MTDLLNSVIRCVSDGAQTFFRYITANDVGTTGGHQAGFYVPKEAYIVLFDTPGIRGENKDRYVDIEWQDTFFSTASRFIYYGVGTRNEYRITRFGRDFPFLRDCYSGSLLVLTKTKDGAYRGYVLSTDEDIEGFFEHFGISPSNRQVLIDNRATSARVYADDTFTQLFLDRNEDFPETKEMAFWGQKYGLCCEQIGRSQTAQAPDRVLLRWIEAEYRLFQLLEDKLYRPTYAAGFSNCNDLIAFANTMLNRRKSRAGRSLEHHLCRIFRVSDIAFTAQAQTEDNKRPDFIFPSQEAYHNLKFEAERLVFLGAKTTCKDRWRQILNEADRIPSKYLFTLQKGISVAQLKEMESEGVSLVVPDSHLSSFSVMFRKNILSLKCFIERVRSLQ